jgi:hypothetical protein
VEVFERDTPLDRSQGYRIHVNPTVVFPAVNSIFIQSR